MERELSREGSVGGKVDGRLYRKADGIASVHQEHGGIAVDG